MKSFCTVLVLGLFILFGCQHSEPISPQLMSPSLSRQIPKMLYGYPADSVLLIEGKVQPNEYLSSILGNFGTSFQTVFDISEKAKPIFPVTNIRSGQPYTIISKKKCIEPEAFVYHASKYRYIKFDLKCGEVQEYYNDIDTIQRTAAGTIDGSLWMAMESQGISPAIIDRMEDALAWSVDFYHIHKGDRFKLVFDEYYIDGEMVGVGDLYGAYFASGDQAYYSIKYQSENYDGYFDQEGRPMKKAFLKSPVKYGRISSHYNMKRFHPVLKRTKPHLGTDYAAPTGTPIMSVADGRVTHVAYTSGNGNYVKIEHDKTYTTQYLHMSRHAKGLKPGHRVKQGQIIGYVGSTGLATGPHVCFRFWKNGVQVNHLRENLPPPEPMSDSELPDFFIVRDHIMQQLDSLPDQHDLYADQPQVETFSVEDPA